MAGSFEVGCHTATGTRYLDLNQDYVAFQEVPTTTDKRVSSTTEHITDTQQCHVAVVLDGHGLLGERAAQQAGSAILKTLCSSTGCGHKLAQLCEEKMQAIMVDAFESGHKAALQLYDDPPQTVTLSYRSSATYQHHPGPNCMSVYRATGQPDRLLECGATCTAAVMQGNTLCVANVGDSAAFLGWDNGESYSAEELSVLHSGLNASEAERVMAHSNNNGPGRATILPKDGYLSVISGVMAGHELSVTRALGHQAMQQHGVSHEPHVRCVKLQPQHTCLVMASDGVWDVMGGHEAVRRVMDDAAAGCTAAEAARHLVEEAVELSLAGGSGDADNTSALVVFFY